MALLRTVLTLMLAGALLGGVIAGWMAPKYLEWNTTSPYATTTQCDLLCGACPEPVLPVAQRCINRSAG